MTEYTKFLPNAAVDQQAVRYDTGPGRPELQGATLMSQGEHSLIPASAAQADGVNFAVYAPLAQQIELCLFDQDDKETRLPMHSSAMGVWHLFVNGLKAGQGYGFRADGQWYPDISPRFNNRKLLLDPYSREVRGEVSWHPALFDYSISKSTGAWNISDIDSAGVMPRSVVREREFDWQQVSKPGTSRTDSVIYELHVKGFSIQNEAIPEQFRGTYLGLSHPASIAYLKQLGVTTVELLPVTSRVSEERPEQYGAQ